MSDYKITLKELLEPIDDYHIIGCENATVIEANNLTDVKFNQYTFNNKKQRNWHFEFEKTHHDCVVFCHSSVSLTGDSIMRNIYVVVKDPRLAFVKCMIGHYYKQTNTVLRLIDTKRPIILASYPGVKIGSDGFGYVRDKDGTLSHFPHIGGVIIQHDVEIMPGTVIARGCLTDTIIKSGTKIDANCHIAHNCNIGRNVLIAANCNIGGSVEIGDNTTIWLSVTIRDYVKIGKNVTINMGSVVTTDVPDGATVSGNWAIPHDKFILEMKDRLSRR